MQKFDEMYAMLPFDGSDVREHYKRYAHWLAQQPPGVMQDRRAEAEMIFRRVGITFAVYGAKDESGAGNERLIPFDLIPRIIPAHEWSRMQQGLVQRVTALNRFIHDVYHGQDILRAGVVPADLILNNAQYRPEMAGVQVPQNIYAHIAGIDIVRAPDAQGQGEYEDFRVHTTESEEAGAVLALPQIPRPERQDAGEDEGNAGWRDSLTVPRVTPEERLHTLECRQAARWIAVQLGAGLHPRDVMVLARKRERLALMQDELRELGIPAQQPEKTDLGEAPEVQDLVALLDALVSPAHDLSLARALKSPLFGVTDDALIELALRQRTQRRPWFELLQGAGWSGSLQHVGPTLLRWKQWVDTLPPHDALDAIYEDGDVLARFVAAAPQTLREGVRAHLQALLAAALQVDGARYATPYAFVRALKAGGVAAPTLADADAVRLLTVHGAKGLEAPLVLLLDTDAPAPRAQTMSVLMDWPGEAEAPRRFVFLASESRLPPSAREAMDAERQERQREELNALYVALTRAQRRLALSAVQPHRGSEGSWWLRLQALCQPAEVSVDPPVRPARTSQEAVAITLPVLPTIDATGSLRRSAVVAPPTPDALIGQAMHRLLEWAPLDAQDWSAEQVQRAASEFGLDEAQARQAAAMALRILQGQGAWAWRSAEIAWQSNEVPVTVQGSVRRIDRLVRRTDGSWWVLDYKSAAQPQARDELSGQLRDYRAAVQAACPGESVRAAFLSASGGVEEVE